MQTNKRTFTTAREELESTKKQKGIVPFGNRTLVHGSRRAREGYFANSATA